MVEYLIRDPDVIRIELVEELPPACGGGVVVPKDDGTIWMLLEPPPEDVTIPDDVDLTDWSSISYEILEYGEPITCVDQARRFGVPVEVAHAAFWVGAHEWQERTERALAR